jgi:hypothetical protein
MSAVLAYTLIFKYLNRKKKPVGFKSGECVGQETDASRPRPIRALTQFTVLMWWNTVAWKLLVKTSIDGHIFG